MTSERAILAAKNKDVYEFNNIIQSNIQREAVTYKSVDTVVEAEFLNSLDLPPHVLQLKIGVPIIMLRNINQPKLCNGTRLAVKKLMRRNNLYTGPLKGESFLIPRIPMIPTDMPFEFKRLQFPIRLAFAITINKVHGQSLELCGTIPPHFLYALDHCSTVLVPEGVSVPSILNRFPTGWLRYNTPCFGLSE
ncbi:uncharacterized protein LOC106459445 [Limulus polyphemus]|uniref:Uncharacterized protein LOC106459445 n=1 Tax=Limulus polyphemus TaxID=6850 RepID=A0ABM1B4A5_LIMPO|nr:uncharacterized protein LOC106459445 [Limulus polyphemus]